MSNSQQTLTQQIDELEAYRGHGTELISVYIPPNRAITTTRSDIQTEHADAQNIKSKATRQRVQRALSMIDGALSQYAELPESGLALFAGVLDTDTGTEEVLVRLTPPVLPIESYRYHCDKTFLTQPLRALDAPDDLVGLLVVDVGSAEIGVLRGTEVVHLTHLDSYVPSKHRQGGQSAARFRRRREETVNEFYRTVGNTASKHFLKYGDALNSIVVGGPLMTRDAFNDGKYLHHSLRDRVRGAFPVDETSQTGLSQLVERAESVLEQHAYTNQRDIVEEFKSKLRSETATYGDELVEHAVELGAVETLLLSEGSEPSPDVVETAEQYGADIEWVATDFDAGNQLDTVFGGIAATLRFPVESSASDSLESAEQSG